MRRMTLFALHAALLLIAVASSHGVAAAAEKKKQPVRVFILAGQSNMEGAGAIKMNVKRNEGQGTLEYLATNAKTAKKYGHLRTKDGNWTKRDDVWIWYLGRKGPLAPGYGSRKDRIGPELGFGHVVGDAYDGQVLLIKTAWGGKSLAKDFRPPSSGGQVGPYYTEMIGHIKDVLGNLKTHFPAYDGRGYQLAGFGWHQGWNDGCSRGDCEQYAENLANFIRDVRKELGAAKLPFVVANSGFGGREQKVDRRLMIVKAQASPASVDEFKGNFACVETRDYFRPADVSPSRQGYHWNSNAETYYLIGESMGRAMIKLSGK